MKACGSSIPQPLTVSETFTLARFGELVLSSGGRLAQPTNVVAPGAPPQAQQALNDRSRILLDDGNNSRTSIRPGIPNGGLSAGNTVRVGDTVGGVTGVLEQRFGTYRVQPRRTVRSRRRTRARCRRRWAGQSGWPASTS